MKFQGESKSLREIIWGLINNYAKKHCGQPTTVAINAIPNVPIPNTQKFWSDRKSRFTDILDPKKDTIKHDCF